MEHLNLRIQGQVQGIFYRATAQKLAQKLGLTGFARNEPDGSVYLEIEGEKPEVEKFLDWCRQGPKSARVEKIETSEGSVQNFTGFKID